MGIVYPVINKIFDKMFFVVGVIILLYGLYCSYDNYMVYRQATDRGILQYKPALLGGEDDKPPPFAEGYVGWLSIDDTGIDYPLMQGVTNDEFLNKDPYGNYSLSGSIFLDSRNKSDLSDPYSLIYGHHLSGKAMFGILDEFMDENYFNAHRHGRVIADGHVYDITLFSAVLTDVYVSEVFDPTEKTGLMPYLKNNSKIWHEPEDGRIIGLSTCKTPDSIYRTCVFGVLKEAGR